MTESARSYTELDLVIVAGATVTQTKPICGECYADHCWRCEGDCGCTHPDDDDSPQAVTYLESLLEGADPDEGFYE